MKHKRVTVERGFDKTIIIPNKTTYIKHWHEGKGVVFETWNGKVLCKRSGGESDSEGNSFVAV